MNKQSSTSLNDFKFNAAVADLRYVISSIKIANDLERIADYAKNIASYIQGDFLTILNQTDF